MSDATEILIAKDGAIHAAPRGSTLPADTDPRTSLAAAFYEVGFTSEDGAAFSSPVDLIEIMSWQRARAVRRDVNTRDFQVAFSAEQWNANNLALSAGGGSAEETAVGVVRFEFPGDDDPLDELALVIDWSDQGYDYRLIFPDGNSTEGFETNLVRTGAAMLPVTFRALEDPPYLVTDDPAFSPIS